MEQLVIDGGIIGNNPAMFAYMTATQLNKITKPIRILSLGTGVAEISKVDPTEFTRFDWLKSAGDRAIDNDVFAADLNLKSYFKSAGREDDYVRMQTISTLSMDKVDPDSIKLLMDAGD